MRYFIYLFSDSLHRNNTELKPRTTAWDSAVCGDLVGGGGGVGSETLTFADLEGFFSPFSISLLASRLELKKKKKQAWRREISINNSVEGDEGKVRVQLFLLRSEC